MSKITSFLWFEKEAEEAVNFYTSAIKNSKVLSVNRVAGQVLTVGFELGGQKFMALNGGPAHKLSDAFSILVSCESQQEVDELWEKFLANGGSENRCGWLKDKYGLSWQIIPTALMRLIGDPDQEKSNAVMQAMFKMKKIIIADLQKAHEGKAAA